MPHKGKTQEIQQLRLRKHNNVNGCDINLNSFNKCMLSYIKERILFISVAVHCLCITV